MVDTVSNDVGGQTNGTNRTKHLGWWPRQGSSGEIYAKIHIDDLTATSCSSGHDPAMARAGVGGFLPVTLPGYEDRRIFAFTGILVGKRIPGVQDGVPHVFYLVQACRHSCLVLDAYAPSLEERVKILAFHAEPIRNPEESVGIAWNESSHRVEFTRSGKLWGERALPAADAANLALRETAFNVGHFVPACPQELRQHADVIFSDLKGF